MSPTGVDFAAAAKQEAAYLRLRHPTPDDIPSCFRLTELAMGSDAFLGQILYRHGESSQCVHNHDNTSFCLSMKWMENDQRYVAWINGRAEWWAKRRLDKSSEDV
ncbi:hypothetical protein EV421DRAFT_2090531 [Armillaria borealis]|uniref:Uncharacterized protein n=1 Tax=Armillaria borealis TaxID=47425 RepID=A0AA39MDJ4_9AGAR|nr:hypothetical protein EV421DRAFT_2090531 [Armillaria borealis]